MNKKTEKNQKIETIGSRIKKIRLTRGLTQAELGEKVGLAADRIQKYESASKISNVKLIENIASALGVLPEALIDPNIDTPIGIIRLLLEIDNSYELKLKEENGTISIYFDNDTHKSGDTKALNKLLLSWYKKWITINDEQFEKLPDYRQSAKVSEYWDWSICYPTYEYDDENDYKEHKIEQLKTDISVLEDELKRAKEELKNLEKK